MAIWDLVNSDKDKYSLGGDSFDTYQSNAAGEDLAPINYKGQLSAVDPDNDSRSPEQYKQDAQAAQRDASNSPDEDENMFISDNGNKYEKVDNSALHEGLAAGMEFLQAYLGSNGNVGEALDASGRKIHEINAQAHRQSQINDLEKKGYNPLDIDVWQKTGDRKALIVNKGEWSAVGDGQTLYNKLTGETKLVAGTNKTIKDTKILDDGNILNTYSDGTQAITNPNSMGGNAPTVQNQNYGPGNLPGGGSLDNADQPQQIGVKMIKGKPQAMDNVYSADGKQAFVGQNNKPVDAQGYEITNISGLTPAQQDKQQAAQEKAQAANQATVGMIDSTIGTVQNLLNHKGFNDIYGKYDAMTPMWAHSQQANSADVIRDQLSGQVFLQARQWLKGQGPITDYESKKAEAAYTILTDGRSTESEARKAGADIIDALNSAKAKLQGGKIPQQGTSQPAQQQGGVITVTRGPDGKLVKHTGG
ncbi:hypothetical protein E2L92_22015 [Salmonella enterica subsp. enterica serovar Ibadan]|nr:hypothetical protein [Salmonella enterica subsp. enterica serovar Ibadan]ECF3282129.1 hypothetical protein [Salmonella enterica subsp. enterica serovar Ibadan]